MAQGALSGEAAEPSAEPRRPEDRPAVVSLLVHGGRPTADAFAATLFELAARDVLHVEEIRITAKADQQLLALPEGASYLGFIFARADTPAFAEHAVRQAHARLRFSIDPLLEILNTK